MGHATLPVTYFDAPGPANTVMTLDLGHKRATELALRHVIVATTSGATAVQAAQVFTGFHVVAVTHSAGFVRANQIELEPQYRAALQALGADILTCQHAFGGVNRAVRKKLGTYQLDEIVAFALRTFGEGTKVACEIALMAADAGLVPAGEPALAIGGSGRGADTAIVLLPTNAQTFFDLRVQEIVCKPAFRG
ncbi:MAG: pyruvate kinase alpha/beta domain-containing protein [Anaerolineae bacterium]